jgi:hypothetical protein
VQRTILGFACFCVFLFMFLPFLKIARMPYPGGRGGSKSTALCSFAALRVITRHLKKMWFLSADDIGAI